MLHWLAKPTCAKVCLHSLCLLKPTPFLQFLPRDIEDNRDPDAIGEQPGFLHLESGCQMLVLINFVRFLSLCLCTKMKSNYSLDFKTSWAIGARIRKGAIC